MTFERQINVVFGLIRTPSEPENVFILRSSYPSPPPLVRCNDENIIAPLLLDQNELDELLELFRTSRNEIEEEYEEEYDPYNHLSEEEYEEYLFDRRMTL